MSRVPNVIITSELIQSFTSFKLEIKKIYSLKSHNFALIETYKQITEKISSIFKGFAKIIVKEAHLNHKIRICESINNLELRIEDNKKKLDKANDEISKGNLSRTIQLLEQQIINIREMTVFSERLSTQRAQIVEECRSIFVKMNALEFTDMKISSSLQDSIETSLNSVENEIQSLESATIQVLSKSPCI